jgi:hypothetical protein
MAAIEDTSQVGIDHRPPIVGRRFRHEAEFSNSRVVDQNVEAAKPLYRRLDEFLDLTVVPNICTTRLNTTCGHNLRQPGTRVRKMRRVDTANRHVGSSRRKGCRNCESDAA